jgi:phage antirepressor YoqD-like protein
MNQTIRKVLVAIALISVILIALYVSLSVYITQKIEDGLSNLPEHIQLKYKQIEIDLLSASAELDSVSIKLNSPDLNTKLLSATLKTIVIHGVSYKDIIFNRKLSINNLKMDAPEVIQFNSKLDEIKKENKEEKNDTKKPVKLYLEQLSITNGSFKKYDSLKNVKISAKALNIFFNEINYNAEHNKKSIPFNFKSFSIDGKSLMTEASEFEILKVESFKITQKLFQLNNGTFQTKYSRSELNKHISKERDHFFIEFDVITAKNYSVKSIDSGLVDIKISSR